MLQPRGVVVAVDSSCATRHVRTDPGGQVVSAGNVRDSSCQMGAARQVIGQLQFQGRLGC